MVVVRDIKEEFYSGLVNQRVLVLVAIDVDAICACKILQYLFYCDHIQYTIIAIRNLIELEEKYREQGENVNHVVLLNCGATIDILETLEPPASVTFYVCDSHRPVDPANFYNAKQVRLLVEPSDVENVPAFDELYFDSESEADAHADADADSGSESKDESDVESRSPESESQTAGHSEKRKKRKRRTSMERRARRRNFERTRARVLFEYTELAYHGLSSAAYLFAAAWKLSRDTNELLWFAIVGLTEQLLSGKLNRTHYLAALDSHVAPHVSRLNHALNRSVSSPAGESSPPALGAARSNDKARLAPDLVDIAESEKEASNLNSASNAQTAMRIVYSDELLLALYRNWTVLDSLHFTPQIVCRFKLWTLRGKKRLFEYLADCGLSIRQCEQTFSNMDSAVRNTLDSALKEYAEKYKLDMRDLILPSYVAKFGYRRQLSALDAAFVTISVLEAACAKQCDPAVQFARAIDTLNRDNVELFDSGLESARTALKLHASAIQSAIDANQMIVAGPFACLFVAENTAEARALANGYAIQRFAKFLLKAYCCSGRNKRAHLLPLVVGVPLPDSRTHNMMIVGVPPVQGDDDRNVFGKAFEQAAVNSRARSVHHHFDSHMIELKMEDRSKFFDALLELLS